MPLNLLRATEEVKNKIILFHRQRRRLRALCALQVLKKSFQYETVSA